MSHEPLGIVFVPINASELLAAVANSEYGDVPYGGDLCFEAPAQVFSILICIAVANQYTSIAERDVRGLAEDAQVESAAEAQYGVKCGTLP